MTTIGSNYTLGTTIVAAASSQVASLATAQNGDEIRAAWETTDKRCFIADLAAVTKVDAALVDHDCGRPQIATDVASATTNIAFERDGGIRLMHISHLHGGIASTLLRPDARSPRIAFDGTRFWITYLDARGDIVIGFLDEDNHLVSTGLVGPAPADGAYELAFVDGRIWVVSVDATNGFMAHQMCAELATEP